MKGILIYGVPEEILFFRCFRTVPPFAYLYIYSYFLQIAGQTRASKKGV